MPEMKTKFVRLGWLTVFLAGSFLAGTCFQAQPASSSEVRKGTPRAHFLSGGERSVPILLEISDTLKRIDSRLARIEEAIATADEP